MLIHCPMDEEERQQDSDLRQSRTAAKISAAGTLEQKEKIRIPPSVSRPVKRKRLDVGGKMYEDELMVLNLKAMVEVTNSQGEAFHPSIPILQNG